MAKDDDEEADPEDDDAGMDAEPTTNNDWDRVVAEAEADGKHCESMLAKPPKHPKYLKQL